MYHAPCFPISRAGLQPLNFIPAAHDAGAEAARDDAESAARDDAPPGARSVTIDPIQRGKRRR